VGKQKIQPRWPWYCFGEIAITYSKIRCLCGHRRIDHTATLWRGHQFGKCLKCKNRKRGHADCPYFREDKSTLKPHRFHKSKKLARKRVNQRLARRG
jgi:hypothetical protein